MTWHTRIGDLGRFRRYPRVLGFRVSNPTLSFEDSLGFRGETAVLSRILEKRKAASAALKSPTACEPRESDGSCKDFSYPVDQYSPRVPP